MAKNGFTSICQNISDISCSVCFHLNTKPPVLFSPRQMFCCGRNPLPTKGSFVGFPFVSPLGLPVLVSGPRHVNSVAEESFLSCKWSSHFNTQWTIVSWAAVLVPAPFPLCFFLFKVTRNHYLCLFVSRNQVGNHCTLLHLHSTHCVTRTILRVFPAASLAERWTQLK